MRRVVPLLAVLALSGCGEAGSSRDFQGEERRVADAIGDIERAGRAQDEEKLCNELFARALVERLQAGSTDCRQEIGTALKDADDFELDVQDVAIRGNRATARVKGPQGVRTLALVREGGRWRLSAFPG